MEEKERGGGGKRRGLVERVPWCTLVQVLEHKSGSVLGRAVLQPSYVAEQPGGAVHRGEWRLQVWCGMVGYRMF